MGGGVGRMCEKKIGSSVRRVKKTGVMYSD